MKNCFECNQECCDNVIVEIDKPTSSDDWEQIKWKVAHKNVRVILDNENDWCVEFVTKCKHIDSDGKCKIYNTRPKICREHKSDCCEVNGEGNYYKIILESIKDVEKYLKEHPRAVKKK